MVVGSKQAQSAARRVLALSHALGEGIVWCPRKHALYWTDIQSATLWRYFPASGKLQHWKLPERLASFALCEQGDYLLLALASKLAFFHLIDGTLHTLHNIEPDLATRCNDGCCDRQGRFVFGTMHEPVDSPPDQAIGSFWRLNTDLSLERLPLEHVVISNSLAFSPDGCTMYYCDSLTRTIRCCNYGDNLSNARNFVVIRDHAGVPDGSCIDVDGGLWNAQWGAGRVVRYRPDGQLDLSARIPVSQPTCACFGGSALDTLYVTSARQGMNAQMLRRQPQSGDLFALDLGQRGLLKPRFAGISQKNALASEG